MKISFGDRFKQFILTICLFWLTIQPCYGVEISDVPQPSPINSNWISDVAEVIDPDTETQINKTISQLEADKSDRIYIVTVPNIPENLTYRDFARDLLFNWHVDRSDSSVIMLLVIGDRHIEIKTGEVIKNIINDSLLKNVIDDTIIPQFKQNDFSQGVLLGTQKIAGYLENPYSIPRIIKSSKKVTLSTKEFFIFIIYLGINIMIFSIPLVFYWLLRNWYSNRFGVVNNSNASDFGGYSDFGGGGDSGDSGGGAGGDW